MNTRLSKLNHRSVVKWLSAALMLLGTVFSAVAQPRLSTETPIGFFTNFAGKLLQSEMGLDLNHIQIYPTNQYTPAVHRLLQVTANIYDCTTNRADLTDYPYLPTIFRPQFTNDNGIIYITGYVEETGTNVIAKKPLDLLNPDDRANLQPDDNIYGIPLVIGAKKGLPNFNEFSMASIVQLTRQLQITKSFYSQPPSNWHYKVKYSLAISNALGAEIWNPYTSAFPRALRIVVTNELRMSLTNEFGTLATQNLSVGNAVSISPLDLPGWTNNYSASKFSFSVPLLTNVSFVPFSIYHVNPPQFSADFLAPFDDVSLTSGRCLCLAVNNCLRVMIIDGSTGRLVDYVQLAGLDDTHDIINDLQVTGTNANPNLFADVWNTNISSTLPITQGMSDQIKISLGTGGTISEEWSSYMLNAPVGYAKQLAIAAFANFYSGAISNLVMQTPFTPTAQLVSYRTWQVNDPLVHYLINDLTDLNNAASFQHLPPFETAITNILPNLIHINTRFKPWGGTPYRSPDVTSFNLSLKDPLVTRSDDWDFPNNAPLSFDWLGRVHRGTPWQTVYLKSPITDFNAWKQWIGNYSTIDAALTHPTNDWNLGRLMISLLNTNRPQDLFSVNQGNLFQSFAQGLNVLTNSTADADLYRFPQFDSVSMLPDSPQAAAILAGRDAQRTLQPGHYFRDPIHILTTPELTVNSPWLNRSYIQQQYGISDAAYEMIPSQILPLLRADSVGTSTTRADGQLELQFTGYDGYAYQVQSSTDLQSWTTIGTQYPTNGTFSIVDPAGTSAEHRYYRSVLMP